MKFQVSQILKKIDVKNGKKNVESKTSQAPVTEAQKSDAAQDNQTEATTVCPKCKQEFNKADVKANLNVCMSCGYHYVISAERRVKSLVDAGTFRPLKCKVAFANPLDYPEYEDKITSLQKKTGLEEAVYTGVGKIDGYEAVIAVMSSKFLMGSMGLAVGEKVTNAVEYADKKKLPLIIFTASGGARMQEGILSLMQMAKTSAAVERFNQNGGLYISVLTHPTTGGVSASFATLGDITLAEPDALIGFAGPRVIEQTIGQKLPEGFQRSEFQQEHGFVDQIVPRDKMRETLAHILRLHCKRGK
ncbi:MAG: acetyl-CoA carboxylase, carboxyltransferase subunit beta [Eubacteriales bacterium]|nr:acetyl-CoA carboxylase, carboxyltransferase subunit beta [Lachnospiraceae bacterium]MDO5126824.1 acetyl-CoA carboxylase, carboxyltransferase subunit beta [Eubacteriales bacterium]